MMILQRYFQLCLLRISPADLPASNWLMKGTLLIYLIVSTVVTHIDYSWFISLLSSFTDMMLMMLVCWLLLRYRALQARYVQVVTAMAGAGTLLNCFAFPILFLFRQFEGQGQVTSLILLLLMIFIFWSLMVVAHIFRKALEISAGAAAILTVAYSIFSIIIVGLVMSGAV